MSSGPPLDSLRRPLRDLRISVTDRCSFRCPYCMPKEVYGASHAYLPRAEILSFDEIARVAAGLKRLTVSCDALDEAGFRRMNGVDFPLERLLEGIGAAERAGFTPLKINAVVRRHWNDAGLVDLVRTFRARGHVVRFIEYMDVGHTNGWRLTDVVPSAEVLRRLSEVFPLVPVGPRGAGQTSSRYRFADGPGEVGFISSVSEPFCGDCTRARLSADGRVFTCLFATRGHDVKAMLRGGADDAELVRTIAAIWRARDDRYSELRTLASKGVSGEGPKVEMSVVGG